MLPTDETQQLRVELGLDGPDRDELGVGGLVDVVEVGAGVEDVGAGLFTPQAHRDERVDHRHQHRGAVDHGRVDDLPLPRPPRLDERARHTEREEHAPATEVADHVQWRHGALALAGEAVQRAGQRDVVDVVARGLRQRPVLAPARHAPEDESGVAGEALVGPEAQAFHDPRPEPFDERVGLLDESKHSGDAVGVLEVDGNRATPTVQHVARRVARTGSGTVDAHHVGTHVGQHHGGERARPDARHLDHPKVLQRSHLVDATNCR